MIEKIADERSSGGPKEPKPGATDTKEAMSPVLKRLIEEVRNESTEGLRAYDRVHNRHNR